MDTRAEEIHIEKDQARGGTTPHIVRYVLMISLFLAIVALSAIWITGALSSNQDAAESAAARPAVVNTP